MAHGDEKSTETIEGLLSDLETPPKRFSPEQLETFTAGFSTSLGSGAFGDVFKGILHDGVQVAVKVLKGALLSDGVQDQLKAEVSIHGKIHHKYVVELYGFCFEQNMKALVYEFMENGSLDKLLYGNQSIAWETLCNIAVGTAKGLAYLHEDCQPRIIHYDVKPANILLDSKFSPKVGDFGLAKLLNPDMTHMTVSRFRGTPNYGAPELRTRYSRVTNKCDVFSFGITLFDIIGRRRHVGGEGEKWFPIQVWTKFKKEKQEEIMQECDIHEIDRKQAKRILLIALQCVQFLPGDRPSMSHVARLLEGTKEVKLPPNPFLDMVSSSSSAVMEEDEKEDELSPNSLGSSSAVMEEDEKDNISRTTLGPWGGNEWGHFWDDGIFVGIKKIEVFREDNEDEIGIQVWYCGKVGESILTKRHGYYRSNGMDTIEFDYPSEYLMRVTGWFDDYIFVTSLCFFTNKKIYGPFGIESGTYFTSEKDGKDGKIVGFHGRVGIYYLGAIGVHIEYNKDRQQKLKVTRVEPRIVGPWGGEEGDEWDDGVPYGIKKIEIYKERDGLSMRIWYCGNGGDPIWSEWHGYVSSISYTPIELDYPSEYLVRVTGYHGFGFGESSSDRVRSLSFVSNKKKYGPFGTKKGEYFNTNENGKDGKVIGFHGRADKFLNAIGVYMDYS